MERRQWAGMTPNEERGLYLRDHFAWCQYAAPRWRDIFINHPDRKRSMWNVASEPLRDELRKLAKP